MSRGKPNISQCAIKVPRGTSMAALQPQEEGAIRLLMRLERKVEDEFRPRMLARLQEEVDTVDKSLPTKGPRCSQCKRAMKSRGRRPSSVLTRFGRLLLHSKAYRCSRCKQRNNPLYDGLGLETGDLSGALARLVALLGVVVPYELAATLCYLFFGVTISPMAVWRAVQRLGEACERHSDEQVRRAGQLGPPCQEQPDKSEAPDVVVAGIDGCTLGMQVRSTRRRRKGKEELPPLPPVEDGHFREVKTGALLLPSERLERSPGRRSVARRILVSCLGNADLIFDRLGAKLCELGWLGPRTVLVIVGDGAEWIWKRAAMFANRCEILDFWHAVEKAWEFARASYGCESKQAATFVHALAADLRAGRIDEVLVRLGQLRPLECEARERLEALIRYYTNNRGRMRYDEYLRLGYGIGSGAVESAHKQVVHARLRQAGMRWSEKGARRLLALRVLLLNHQWSQLDRLTMVGSAV